MTNSGDKGAQPAPRRRGRRPKGGKLVAAPAPPEAVEVPAPNIILHLRCRVADLRRNTFSLSAGASSGVNAASPATGAPFLAESANAPTSVTDSHADAIAARRGAIDKKLRNLAIDLKTNNTSDTRSSCFWCTCAFDNPPVHLPRHRLDGTYQCYGCFCSPECAAGFLFAEDLDAGCKFERFHLLNHLYKSVYGYKDSIKPAPDPRYTLDKFYGNLTIDEYRESCTRPGVLLVADYPLTRVLPELHRDSSASGECNGTGRYKLRRRSQQSKSDILTQNFRLGPPPAAAPAAKS